MIDRTPRLRLGAEYNFNNTFAYCLEIGVGNTFINKNRLSGSLGKENYQFFEVRPEVKYYFNNSATKKTSMYCATELFFITAGCKYFDSYYHLANRELITYYDEATFRKIKYGCHIKGGIKQVLFKRVTIDFYGGLGIAKRKIAYSDVVNPDTGDYSVFEEWLPQPEQYEGESTFTHLTGGCKIGWMF